MRRGTLRILSVALVIIGTPPLIRAHAEETAEERPLDLLEAARSALAHFPSVGASRAELEAAIAAAHVAAAARFPSVSVGGSATQYEESMIVHPIHDFGPDLTPPFDSTLFQVLANASYTVYDGGARGARIEEARHRSSAAEASLGVSERDLLTGVVSSYLDALTGNEVLAAHDARLIALERELERVRQLHEVGRAARVEMLLVEAALANAEADRVRLELALDLAERALARWTGKELSETNVSRLMKLALVDRSSPPAEGVRERALRANPSVQRAREQVGAAEAAATAARSRRRPHLDVVARYVDWGSASGANSLEWNLGLEVSYPVFTGGSVGSAIDQADASRRSALELMRLAEYEVSEEIDRSLSALNEAIARHAALATAVARFEEVSRIEQLRLDNGVGVQTDYLDAHADLLAARAQRIEAEYEVIRAHVRLARVSGDLSVAWLETHLRSRP